MQEYTYNVISVPIRRGRTGLSFEHDYLETINEQAQQGWQFVQALNLESHSSSRIDLIFTRKN